MKDFFKKFLQAKGQEDVVVSKKGPISRQELETKAIQGARQAMKDYRRVFERLAEYDRA